MTENLKTLESFYAQHYDSIYKQTLEKFKELFKPKEEEQDEEEWKEELANIFWFGIVEPGWSPKEVNDLDKMIQDWEPEEYNLAWEKFYEVERKVCIEINIPVTTIDL